MTGPLHEGDPKAYQYHPRPIIPEDFPWRHGMTALLYGRRWLLQWVSLPDAGYGHLYRIAGDCRILFTKEEQAAATPDPTDGATLGALLAAVREVWGFEDLSARRCSRGTPPGVWLEGPRSNVPYETGWGFDHYRGCVKAQELARRVGIQPSEFAALLAAWEARR